MIVIEWIKVVMGNLSIINRRIKALFLAYNEVDIINLSLVKDKIM
jgi:hypothetical protein